MKNEFPHPKTLKVPRKVYGKMGKCKVLKKCRPILPKNNINSKYCRIKINLAAIFENGSGSIKFCLGPRTYKHITKEGPLFHLFFVSLAEIQIVDICYLGRPVHRFRSNCN